MSDSQKRSDAPRGPDHNYATKDFKRSSFSEGEPENNQIARTICELRERAGLSQKELAELLETSQSVISRLENGEYQGHSLSILHRITKALNQPVRAVIGPDGISLAPLMRRSGGSNNNLLVDLHRYAHRQSENFTTAAFVHLLRRMRDDEPRAFRELMGNLTVGWMSLAESDIKEVVIVSQLKERGQIPDIQILAPTAGRETIIELKLWAILRETQLAYARSDRTRLVVITVDPLPFGVGPEIIELRWSRVKQLLNDLCATVGEESNFLIRQFTDFITGREQSGKGSGVLTFVVAKPDPDRFQHVLVPLVRKEMSINGLVDLFLHGPGDDDKERELHVVFGQHGCVASSTPEGDVRDWIIQTLIRKGLAPDCGLHSAFKLIAYLSNGDVVDLDLAKLGVEVGFDAPLRIICRPTWFAKYGSNSAMQYFGGPAACQEEFYGEDGRGGRFPLRPGTEIPGDVPLPVETAAMYTPVLGGSPSPAALQSPAHESAGEIEQMATQVPYKPGPSSASEIVTGQFRAPTVSKRLKFIKAPDPDPGKFQYALTPLVMKEFTLQELTEIFVFGLGGGPNVDFRTDLFKRDDGWIQEQSRAFIRRGLTNLFGRGAGIVQGESRTAIGRWIIQQLLNCGLDPNGLRGWDKPYELVRAFQFVKYSADGQPEELTRESIWAIDDDVPIRLICRPLWFRWYGNNRASHLYFGGSAQDQSVFYGNNGRFPMRPGTRVPGDLAKP